MQWWKETFLLLQGWKRHIPSASYKSAAPFHQPKEAASLSQNQSAFGSSPHACPFPLFAREKGEVSRDRHVFNTLYFYCNIKVLSICFLIFSPWKGSCRCLYAVQLLHIMKSDRAVQSLGSFQSTGFPLRNPTRWALGLIFFPKLFWHISSGNRTDAP